MIRRWVKDWWLLLVPALFAAGAVLAYALTFRTQPATENPSAWGTFGDYLGGLLNPLVSTLTLFVALSVWRLQKAELELTRRELESSRLAMEDQAKTSEQQRQEQRFFDLFNVYLRTLESISYTRSRSSGKDSSELLTSNGKQAISVWLNYSSLDHTALSPHSPSSIKSKVESRWQTSNAPSMFDHYFRVVFRLLSEAENLLSDQHYRYVELFQAQFSRSELMLLGFNLWLEDEDQHMAFLAEKYHLLKHLPTGHLRTEMETLHPYMFRPKQAQPDQLLHQSESESYPC